MKLLYKMIGNTINTSSNGDLLFNYKIIIERSVPKGFAINDMRTKEKLLQPLIDSNICVPPHYQRYDIDISPSFQKDDESFKPMLLISFPKSSNVIRKSFSVLEFDLPEDPIIFDEEGDLTDYEPVDQKKYEEYLDSVGYANKESARKYEEYKKSKAAEDESKTIAPDEQENILCDDIIFEEDDDDEEYGTFEDDEDDEDDDDEYDN